MVFHTGDLQIKNVSIYLILMKIINLKKQKK